MNKDQPIARCVRCYSSFTEQQLRGATCCPTCKSKGLPMHPHFDVTISINVHELRILGIWAENFAVQQDNLQLDNPSHESLKETVNFIAERIESQLKALGKHMPVTLSREVKELQDSVGRVDFYRDGREEVP